MSTTVTKTRARKLPDPGFSGTPYGNFSVLSYNMTLASGVFTESDSDAVIADGAVVILGVLPKGMKLNDAKALISTAFTSSSTFNIGFQYVDGVDDDDVPEDADYFFSALAASTAALTRKTTITQAVTLPKDAYLILTNTTAQAASGVIDIDIMGVIGN